MFDVFEIFDLFDFFEIFEIFEMFEINIVRQRLFNYDILEVVLSTKSFASVYLTTIFLRFV